MDAAFGFEWDENKDRKNREKHGFSFDDAAQVFLDENRIEAPSSYPKEKRYTAIGRTLSSEILYIVFTWRTYENEEKNCRIISARKAGKKERRRYSRLQ
jgi:uncharacterized DUF497 family protein